MIDNCIMKISAPKGRKHQHGATPHDRVPTTVKAPTGRQPDEEIPKAKRREIPAEAVKADC